MLTTAADRAMHFFSENGVWGTIAWLLPVVFALLAMYSIIFRTRVLGEDVGAVTYCSGYPDLKVSCGGRLWVEPDRLNFGSHDRKKTHFSITLSHIKDVQTRYAKMGSLYHVYLPGTDSMLGAIQYLDVCWKDPEDIERKLIFSVRTKKDHMGQLKQQIAAARSL